MLRKQISEHRRARRNRPTQYSRPAMSAVAVTKRRAELLIAEEQDLRNYIRAPYDPLYGAQAARFYTRGVLHAAGSGGFSRVGAVAIMFCAVVGCAIGTILTVHTAVVRDGLWGAAVIWTTFFTFMFGALVFALLSRLRGRNQAN